MNNPLISIIVPAYNVANYLPVCLDSLLQQTYPNIEIIVINDGSTDQTKDIADRYLHTQKNIILINQKNEGLSGARNTGIKQARGNYICFVDSDDWVEKDMIQKAVYSLTPKDDVVLWGYIKEYTHASIKQPLAKGIERFSEGNINFLYQRIIGPVNEQLKHPECVDSYITAWGKLYKASIIRDNQIQFVSTKKIGTEDLLFNVQFFSHVKNAVILPDCLNHYRKTNTSSLTSNYKSCLFAQWTILQSLVWEIIKGDTLLEEAFYNRIACTMIGLGLNETSANTSYYEHRKNIMRILNENRYQKAFHQLKFRYLPVYWKIFFSACRFRVFPLYWLLIKIIKRIIQNK